MPDPINLSLYDRLFHPFDNDLSEREQDNLFVTSICAGIITLGFLHLGTLFYEFFLKDRVIELNEIGGTAKKVKDTADKVLQDETDELLRPTKELDSIRSDNILGEERRMFALTPYDEVKREFNTYSSSQLKLLSDNHLIQIPLEQIKKRLRELLSVGVMIPMDRVRDLDLTELNTNELNSLFQGTQNEEEGRKRFANIRDTQFESVLHQTNVIRKFISPTQFAKFHDKINDVSFIYTRPELFAALNATQVEQFISKNSPSIDRFAWMVTKEQLNEIDFSKLDGRVIDAFIFRKELSDSQLNSMVHLLFLKNYPPTNLPYIDQEKLTPKSIEELNQLK